MKQELNQNAIVGMAIATAFMRSGWNARTRPDQVSHWQEIIDLAEDYCHWAGLGAVEVTEASIKESIWGIDLTDE